MNVRISFISMGQLSLIALSRTSARSLSMIYGFDLGVVVKPSLMVN